MRPSSRTPRRLGSALILLGIFLSLLWLGLKAGRAYSATHQAMAQLDALQTTLQNPQDIEENLALLKEQVDEIHSHVTTLRAETRTFDPLLVRLSWVPRFGPELAATPHLTALAADLSSAGADMMEIASILVPLLENGEDPLQQSIQALQQQQHLLERAHNRLQHANYERTLFDPGLLDDGPFGRVGPLLDQLDSILPLAERALGLLNVLLPKADTLLGMESPQRYLLLGQSNFELRATGGFLGSLGPMTVEQGKITDLDYRRSPEWDNPEREKVQPPLAYERYMRFGAWFIRDANWYADFPTSAQKIEWFWELDGHEPVQGVIGVDLYAVQNILAVVGTLEVPGYGISVGGADTLEAIWEGHRQDKQRFLSALVEAAAVRLQQPDLFTAERLLDMLQALNRSLEEKHILLYFDDPELQAAIVEAGWGGALRHDPGDSLMVVDSDFSWSEVNRFVQEDIHYQVTLNQDLWVQESTVTLTYWNHFDRWKSGGTNEPFGGACFDPEIEDIRYSPGCYGNYIRLYVPYGSHFVSAEGFDDGMDYYQETGHTVIAGYLRVFPGEQRTVSVTYRPPVGPLDGAYRLTLQKQPGTDARPLQVEIRIVGSEPAEAGLQTDLRVDRVITAEREDGHLLVSGEGQLLADQDPDHRKRQQAFAEGMELWEAGRREQALDKWDRDGVPDLVLDRANLLLSRGQLEQAEDLCRAALELSPDSSRAHFILGQVLLERNDPGGAIQALETAVELDPENRSARQELGLLYEAQGDRERAYAHLQHADAAEANHILWMRAWEHFNGGKEQAGLDALWLILQLDPSDANAHFVQAERLRAQKRYDEALAAYEAAHQVAPKDVRFYIGRAQLYAEQGQGEAAIADLETAVELAPRSAEAWFLLGQFRWTLRQDAEGAIAALKQAVDLQTNTWYATALGNVYRDSGDLDAAVRSYELAVRLPGHTASTWATLGDAYRAQERWERAVTAYAEAVALAPENAGMHAKLAQAYEKVGRILDAIAEYEAALALQPGQETWQRALESLRD